mmetsp:Transcript_106264/g.307685  ORF Transcript_106264/g.307685 Transcript_106264/m.307685 type:complete len:201 (+) Transcript_106264:2066-2668(+)
MSAMSELSSVPRSSTMSFESTGMSASISAAKRLVSSSSLASAIWILFSIEVTDSSMIVSEAFFFSSRTHPWFFMRSYISWISVCFSLYDCISRFEVATTFLRLTNMSTFVGDFLITGSTSPSRSFSSVAPSSISSGSSVSSAYRQSSGDGMSFILRSIESTEKMPMLAADGMPSNEVRMPVYFSISERKRSRSTFSRYDS